MKAVILAGGRGTRISEESTIRPKPMVEIGGKPILWHIMKIYSCYGVDEFIICLGYKGYIIKEYFANYLLHQSDLTIDLSNNKIEVHGNYSEPWKVTLVDTGDETLTGGRLMRVRNYLDKDEPFCVTYGDGLADINIAHEINFHQNHGKLATVAAVLLPGRFGALIRKGDLVEGFVEKPGGDGAWINGGFFILSTKVFDHIKGDMDSLEVDMLGQLVQKKELMAFEHKGFWQAMDTLRDKDHLEGLWQDGHAPWKKW